MKEIKELTDSVGKYIAKTDKLESEMNRQFGNVRAEINHLNNDMNEKFAEVHERFDRMEKKLDDAIERLDTSIGELRATNHRIIKLEEWRDSYR